MVHRGNQRCQGLRLLAILVLHGSERRLHAMCLARCLRGVAESMVRLLERHLQIGLMVLSRGIFVMFLIDREVWLLLLYGRLIVQDRGIDLELQSNI